MKIMLNNIILMFTTLLGFSLIVVIHELGHFLFCKLFNIEVPTFSVGMGPAIFKKKIGNTEYRLSALPLGGYVEIPEGEGEQHFSSKPFWQKILVMLGGIMFNLASAYLIYLSFFCLIGMPEGRLKSIKAIEIMENSPASNIIYAGDSIKGINGKLFLEMPNFKVQDYSKTVNENKGKSLTFLIENTNGDKKEVSIDIPQTDAEFGILKIVSQPEMTQEFGPKHDLFAGIQKANATILEQIKGIGKVISYMTRNRTIEGVGGPVMILSESFKMAQSGLIYFVLFLAFISVNLALINLLPLGMLDGGQVLIVTIETIAGRSLPILKNIVFLGSAALLGTLMIILSYREIVTLIKNTFK